MYLFFLSIYHCCAYGELPGLSYYKQCHYENPWVCILMSMCTNFCWVYIPRSRMCLCAVLADTVQEFYQVFVPIYISSNSIWEFQWLHCFTQTWYFFSHSGEYLVLPYLTVVSIGISLIPNEIGHSFRHLLRIWISFSVKCLFAYFYNRFVFLVLVCRNSLYILEISPLSDILLISFPTELHFFSLDMTSFNKYKFLILI